MPLKYWEWVEEQAKLIKSDGCTHALELARKCCWEHDLAFYYGRDPRHAYTCGWRRADKIGFVETNNRLGGCLPWWLKYRWLAVMGGGWILWCDHRRKRP